MTSALTVDLVTLGLIASITPLGVLGVFTVTGVRRGNGVAFVLGWASVLGVLALVGAVLLHGREPQSSGPNRWFNAAVAVFGVAVVAGAFVLRARQRRRAAAGEAASSRLEGLGTFASYVAGIAMAPYPVGIAGGVGLMTTESGPGARLVALVVFLVLSTWTMWAIVVVLYAGTPAMKARLEAWHGWVDQHRADIFFWLLVVLGLWIAVPAAVTAIRGYLAGRMCGACPRR